MSSTLDGTQGQHGTWNFNFPKLGGSEARPEESVTTSHHMFKCKLAKMQR